MDPFLIILLFLLGFAFIAIYIAGKLKKTSISIEEIDAIIRFNNYVQPSDVSIDEESQTSDNIPTHDNKPIHE